MKKYKIGYTQGTFDMFHIGHLNLLKAAKKRCDYLIVGVNSDELVKVYKGDAPVISEEQRLEIVSNIKCVDIAVVSTELDKNKMFERYHFNAIFIGSDWKNNPRWIETQKEFKSKNVDVVFLKHTDGISSSTIKNKIRDKKK